MPKPEEALLALRKAVAKVEVSAFSCLQCADEMARLVLIALSSYSLPPVNV